MKQGQLRVLVVDDEPDIADSMAMLLRIWGHDPVVAYDGEEAVRAARRRPPDCVFSDLRMPGLDGYQLAGLLRQDAATKDALLVAVSAHADEATVRAAGFDALLIKPAKLDALRALLERGGAS
jgi:CheY-like chemotaxis protein